MTIVTFSNLSKPDGSAIVDQNDTIVQAYVVGPTDVPFSKINYEEAVVDILFKPKVSLPSTCPEFDFVRDIEYLLKTIFKEVILTRLHPRTCISITVQEIYNGGCLTSAAINAVCCALVDAGIPMKSPVAGVTLSLEKSDCKFNFVFDNNYDLISVITRGSVDEDTMNIAIEKGMEKAKESFEAIREQAEKRFLIQQSNNKAAS